MTKFTRLSITERKLCSQLGAKGVAISRIAARLGRTRAVVRRWVDEGKQGRPNFNDKPGRGRKPLLNSVQRSAIKRSARNKSTVATITRRLNKSNNSRISSATVRRVVAGGQNPLQWLPINRGRQLSEKNKAARVAFCLSNPNPQVHNWVFVDGKFFYFYRDTEGSLRWCCQDPENPVVGHRVSNPVVFFFYVAIAYGHKSKLYFATPTPPAGTKQHKSKGAFESKHFISLIKQMKREVQGWFPGNRRFYWILDHASQHTSKVSKAAMHDLGITLKAGFPAQCWDINVIENVWAVLDGKLVGTRACTPDGWRDAIKEAWDQVQLSTINKLVDSVKPRLAQIVELEGEWLSKKKG